MAPNRVRAAATICSLSSPETLTSTVRPWPIPDSKMPRCRLTPNMPGMAFMMRVKSGIILRASVSWTLVPPNRVTASEET